MNSKFLVLFFSISAFLSLISLKEPVDYFNISKKDVKFVIPNNFPQPVYNFKGNKLTPEIFVLGRALFYDEILSKDNTVSCATCHERIAAFAHIDHKLSHGIYGKIGSRNVPPIQNLVWKKNFMWDGGINHIEVQPIGPITNKIEMDETIENVINKLKSSDKYKSLFQLAYKDDVISSERMLKAITQFIGLMVSSNARYDKFVQKKDTLSESELKGLSLFKDKCASCHTEPLFTNNEFANNGLKIDTSLNDFGRYMITKNENDRFLFSIPSLRNIQMTYPYMHDGRYRTLKDVLNFYSSDAVQNNSNIDERIKKVGKLNDQEKKDLISFLLTLTDKTFLYDRRFANPSNNLLFKE